MFGTSSRLIRKGRFSAEATKIFKALASEILPTRATLIPALKNAESGVVFKMEDFTKLNTLRQLFAEIDGMKFPENNFWFGDNFDYRYQATLRKLSKSGDPVNLTLEEAFNVQLNGTFKITTGSANTLESAITNAKGVMEVFGLDEVVHMHTAMSPDVWPRTDEAFFNQLLERNVANEASLLMARTCRNEAAQTNKELLEVSSSSHSYGIYPDNLSREMFAPRFSAFDKCIQFAGLSFNEMFVPSVEVKCAMAGKISSVRSGFDMLEEVAVGFAKGQYAISATDVRVKVSFIKDPSGHQLTELARALKEQHGVTDLASIAKFVDANYTVRPGDMKWDSTEFEGSGTYIVTPRGGDQYTTDAWLKAMEPSVESMKEKLEGTISAQQEQLNKLNELSEGGLSGLQEMATNLKSLDTLLKTDPEVSLFDVVKTVNEGSSAINVKMASDYESISSSLSETQKQDYATYQQSYEEAAKQVEEASKEVDEVQKNYEPEELTESQVA